MLEAMVQMQTVQLTADLVEPILAVAAAQDLTLAVDTLLLEVAVADLELFAFDTQIHILHQHQQVELWL